MHIFFAKIASLIAAAFSWIFAAAPNAQADIQMNKVESDVIAAMVNQASVPVQTQVSLSVPYTSQAPTGSWSNPWWEGCEEASATMVAYYYLGNKNISSAEAVNTMNQMFAWENNNFHQNFNTNATDTANLIRSATLVNTVVHRNPTVEDIKAELQKGHPVLALVDRYELYTNLTSGLLGTSYHVVVISGYDDKNGTFTIKDPARPHSAPTAVYSYDRLMKALHDFNTTTKEADGMPTVIFTSPKK